MKINKRLLALNALADIRNHIRISQPAYFTKEIISKFNLIAQYMGADIDWCIGNFNLDNKK